MQGLKSASPPQKPLPRNWARWLHWPLVWDGEGTIDVAEEKRLTDLLLTTPRLANDVLNCEDEIEEIAKGFVDYNSALFIGRNTMWPLALEGAA